mmetsp:Transcript_18016/g.57621  ORF Transcript_18016/g.57621 Transcript_18016/m.57621 type:complete len:1112 (-) Transcript_18016:161-3496(-)
MSSRVWESDHIPVPITKVWELVRGLKFDEWMPESVESVTLVDGGSPFVVGSVREVKYKNDAVWHLRLLELSELQYMVSWEVVSTEPAAHFSSRVDTIQLRRVSESDGTFIEWTTDFSADATPAVTEDCRLKKQDALSALHRVFGVADVAGAASGVETGCGEWDAKRIRQTYIDYFAHRCEHTFVASSPVVPLQDPTLLFANAGMNQFKPIFLGQVDPSSPLAGLRRACNSQKCIRAGGKHNDLDDVGKDVYHHTFFEMLGNWSFGDYFKSEAITWAWDLLTNVYGLEKERLYATYFGGDEADGLPADEEARQLWLQFLPAERVLPFDRKDNFWEMGDTGPCGPCTEIHYDRIGGRDAAHLVNMDDPNVLEIWNLVFIQFNREPSGALRPLPAKHVDTGMGFERLTSVLQGKMSNYDTDVFQPIFAAIRSATGAPAYQGRVGAEDTDGVDMAYRVVADHIRTLTFAITDGAVPSHDGRGYVLRRILRRAVRYGQQKLGAPKGFFHTLVPVVVKNFGDMFPELVGKQAFVMEVLADEEAAFGRTLAKGIRHFNEQADALTAEGRSVVPGSLAFFLYDTMGFPVDLTQIMAEERGMAVDVDGYEVAMAEAKKRSQEASRFKRAGAQLVMEAEQTAHLSASAVQPTDTEAKYVWYKNPEAKVRALYTPAGFVDSVEPGAHEVVGVVLDRTSFYAEAGGQAADSGALQAVGGGASFEVLDVQSYGGFVLHVGQLAEGRLAVGDAVKCRVDYKRRELIAPNHTMTHVLNFALRKVLGPAVDQKGSEVREDRLRFDFNHGKSLTKDELGRVEAIVNDQIERALPVHTKVVPLAEAQRIHSLRAVFGEQYPDPVRVVAVGHEVQTMVDDPENEAWGALSVEFCGGTHLTNTAQAKHFALVEEGSIAKGIRRVVAITGEAASDAHTRGSEVAGLVEVAHVLHGDELAAKIVEVNQALDQSTMSAALKLELKDRVKVLEKRLVGERKAAMEEVMGRFMEEMRAVADKCAAEAAPVLVHEVEGLGSNVAGIRKGMDLLKAASPATSVALFSVDDIKGRLLILLNVSDAHKGKLDAKEWLNSVLAVCEGRGGGKPQSAQGQGTNLAKKAEAMEAARAFAASKL